jgi:hypothetical protein
LLYFHEKHGEYRQLSVHACHTCIEGVDKWEPRSAVDENADAATFLWRAAKMEKDERNTDGL